MEKPRWHGTGMVDALMLFSRSQAVLSMGILALGGCAEPMSGEEELPAISSLESVVGDQPVGDEASLDTKADGVLPRRFTDLIAQQSPVRSQGTRGLCAIFSSTALLEHLAIRDGESAPDYSEQFLQWSMKREASDDVHTEASTVSDVMANLAARGDIAEALWPYEKKPWGKPGHPECVGAEELLPVDCFTNGEPPAAALAGPRKKLPAGRSLRASSIKTYLYTQHTPVVAALQFINESWSYPLSKGPPRRPDAWARGEVRYPLPSELTAANARPLYGHAVLIVGWDDDYGTWVIDENGHVVRDAAGRPLVEYGFYIVKNSWGTNDWGKTNPYGAGYGLISQRYVEEFGRFNVVGLLTGPPLPATGERHEGGSGMAIKPGATTTEAIDVANAGPFKGNEIEIAITHPHPPDLAVRVSHDGLTWTLWNHESGVNGIAGTWVLEDDSGMIDRSGPWILTVEDVAGGMAGTLTHWAMTLR